MRPVFRNNKRLRIGKVEDLPDRRTGRHSMPQSGAASGTASETVINHSLGVGYLFQRLTLVALLAARVLSRGFPEASHP